MRSRARPSFWRLYHRLDPRIQAAARRAFQQFTENPDHPSLRFKKLAGLDRAWSVRISADYRAVGERDGDTIEWAWIGSHNDFDNMFT